MKRAAGYILLFIIATQTIGIITGCTQRAQPKAWLSVEKKPMRVIYVDYHKDITPQTAQNMIDQVSKIPFHDTKIEPMTGIIVDYDDDVHRSNRIQIEAGVN